MMDDSDRSTITEEVKSVSEIFNNNNNSSRSILDHSIISESRRKPRQRQLPEDDDLSQQPRLPQRYPSGARVSQHAESDQPSSIISEKSSSRISEAKQELNVEGGSGNNGHDQRGLRQKSNHGPLRMANTHGPGPRSNQRGGLGGQSTRSHPAEPIQTKENGDGSNIAANHNISRQVDPNYSDVNNVEQQSLQPGAFHAPGRAVGGAPAWIRARRQRHRVPSRIASNLPIAAELAPGQDYHTETVVMADAIKTTNRKWILLLAGAVIAISFGVGFGVGFSRSRRQAESPDAKAETPKIESVTMCPKWNLTMIDEISQLEQQEYNARRCRIKQLISRQANSSAQIDFEICESAPEPTLDKNELCSPSNLAIWLLVSVDGQRESNTTGNFSNTGLLSGQLFALATMYIAFDGQLGQEAFDLIENPKFCTNGNDDEARIICVNRNLVEFSFFRSNLKGKIPSEIGLLTSLTYLDLSKNILGGPLPVELFQLTSLEFLALGGNFISGSLPTEIGMLSNLETLSLSSNMMNGIIPTEIGQLSRLEYWEFDVNFLTGEIPSEIGNMTQLLMVNGQVNSLSGGLPSQIGKLTKLVRVYFTETNLTLSIPSEIGNLVNLKLLRLDGCDMTGTIPATIGNATNLEFLRLDDNELTGPLPSELGMLEKMIKLEIWGNNILGTLPSEFGRLTNLQFLDLANNELTGTLPDSWASLDVVELILSNNMLEGNIDNLSQLTNLVEFYLDNNLFQNTLPVSIGNWTSLTQFVLQNNSFSGSIPVEVNQLTNLVVFDVGNNRLSGPIPSYLSNLPSLKEMNLGGNSFSGPILFSEFGSTLSQISVDNNMLTGQIPSNLGNLEESLRILTVSNNRLSGNIPDAIGLIRNLEILDLSNNEFLVGSIPDVIGDLSEIRRLSIGGTGLTGTIPSGLCRGPRRGVCVEYDLTNVTFDPICPTIVCGIA